MALTFPRQQPLVKPLVGPGNELYDTLARTSPTSVGKLLRFIDTPARNVREFLTNKPNATGEDILSQIGLSTGNRIADTVAGLGTEILFDPLNLVSFGSGAGGKAVRAARAANIFDDAPRVFSRALVDSGDAARFSDDAGSWLSKKFGPDAVGTRAAKAFTDLGYTDAGKLDWKKVTDADLSARPLVGRRGAFRRNMPGTDRQMTLGDLVKAQADPKKALGDVGDFARRQRTTAEGLLNQPMYKDVGVGIPGMDSMVSFNLPGGEAFANVIDNVGDAVRWSPVGRKGAQLFDQRVRGTYDEGEQIIAKRLSRADEIATRQAAGKVSDLINKFDPELVDLSRQGANGKVLRALIENTYEYLDDATKGLPEVKELMSPSRAVQRDALVGEVREFFKGYLRESRDAGIKSAELQDQYGTQYLGRVLDRALYPDLRAAGVGASGKSVLTGDMQARGDEFRVAGGTNTLTELSGQDFLRNEKLSDKEVAKEVLNFIRGKEAIGKIPNELRYTKADAMKLGRKLRAMDSEALENGKRLFAQHPMEIIDRYATGREKAMGRARELQTLLAQTAKPGMRGSLAGGGYKSVTQTARNLGMESKQLIGPLEQGVARPYAAGAAKNIIDTMQQFGISVDSQTLRRFSVDPELQKRLSNISNFYRDDRTKTAFGKAVGAITANFKQWVLAIPRRYSRDWYSGLFSNFVTHPNPNDLMAGYGITKDIMQQNWEAAAKKLQGLPRYQSMSADEIVAAVRKEMAQSGMSQSGRLHDIGYENIAKEQGRDTFAKYLGGDGRPITTPAYAAWDALTGHKGPSLFSKAYAGSEMATGKNWLNDILPFEIKDGIKFPTSRETTNPILRASARAAETTDEINRLGGYFAMIAGGYSPEAAAKAVTRAQIDYSSLTPFERKFLSGGLFPFWAYLSRISVWGTQEMLENQRFFNAAIRTPLTLSGSRGEEYAPTRIEERYGIKIPDEYREMFGPLLQSKVEGNTYLADIDIPFVDSILMIDPVVDPDTGATSISKTAEATLQSLAGQTNPMVKGIFETISGRDLYTKTELDPTRRTIPTLARRAGVLDAGTQEALGFLEPILTQLAPGITYPLSAARRITSEKTTLPQGASQAAFNLLTGTRVETVGPEEELRDVRERIGRYLESSPYARRMTTTYIPEDQKEFVPQKISEIYELDKELQKRQRELRMRRVQGNPLLTY